MKPGPVRTGLTGEWYGFLAAAELRFQRCTSCGRWRHPPRVSCARCASRGWSWEPSTRRGEIHSWTITHQAVHPDWVGDVPYAIVVAAMQEPGVRLVAGWDGPLDALELGRPILADLRPREHGVREDGGVREDILVVPVIRPAR